MDIVPEDRANEAGNRSLEATKNGTPEFIDVRDPESRLGIASLDKLSACEDITRNGMKIDPKYHMNLFAVWDEYPQIYAPDRYFSLDDAHTNPNDPNDKPFITEERLLSTVTSDDREDGNLTDRVKVIDLNQDLINQFDHGGSFTVTYEVTDNQGNVTHKTITVHLVDTGEDIYEPVKYKYRFISDNYTDAKSIDGGLEPTSWWQSDDPRVASYYNELKKATTNQRENMAVPNLSPIAEKILELSGKKIKVPGTGNFKNQIDATYTFSPEEVQRAKDYALTHEIGNAKGGTGSAAKADGSLAEFRSEYMK